MKEDIKSDLKIRLDTLKLTSQPCCKLFKQLASSLWIKSLDNQSTCIKPIDNLHKICYHQAETSNATSCAFLTVLVRLLFFIIIINFSNNFFIYKARTSNTPLIE